MSVKVKICGLTNLADALCAVENGADYLGFVMVDASPRNVSPAHVEEIARGLPPDVTKIAVLVNRTYDEIVEIVDTGGFDIVQLHGDEPAELATRLGVERVWKCFSVRTPHDVDAALAFPCQAALIDTVLPGQRGGTGHTGDWSLAADLAAKRCTVLAGGLCPDNVAEAVSRVAPFAVDVSSGVEATKGKKDHARVAEFIRRARAVPTDCRLTAASQGGPSRPAAAGLG